MNIVKLFKLGSKILPYIPYQISYAVCGAVAFLVYWLMPKRRQPILQNLAHVLPDDSLKRRGKVARGIIKNNLCNYIDIIRVGGLTFEQVQKQITVIGTHHIWEAQKRGKGVLIISGHFGSFSFILRMSSNQNLDFNLVVEPIKPPELFEFIKNQRQSDHRAKVIPIGGITVREIFRALKRNEIVCIAIDRDITGDGVPMDFFGAPAPIPLGAAEIAFRTGAEIAFVNAYRLPNGKQVVEFHPGFLPEPGENKQAATEELTARMLLEIERLIRFSPENWVVLQPIWKD